MTDFFTRLAERTLGVAPLAQPRVASLFAPVPHVAFESPQESAPLELQASGEFLPVRSPAAEHAISAVLQGVVPLVRSEPALQDNHDKILPAEPIDQTAVVGSRAEKGLKPENQPLLVQGKRIPRPAHETTGSPLEEARGSLSVSSELRPTIVSSQAAGSRESSGFITRRSLIEPADALSSIPTSGSQSAAEFAAHTINRGPAIAPSQAAGSLTRTGSVRTRSLNEPADAFSSSVPAIRVTIGRVEVRAILPPAPAPRTVPSRSGSAPSLENYLKQRSGEGR